MRTFTIDEQNNITAFPSQQEAAATETPFDSFASQKELAELAKDWPTERLVAIWNSLAGVTPVKSFKSNKGAISRIWARIQGLGAPPKPQQKEPTNAGRKPKGGAQAANNAPARGKATKKASPTKNAPKRKKSANARDAAAAHEGSKTATVVAMLRRKGGATLPEIMKAMGWQAHTIRGFMAGAMKKIGHRVESFKPEGGERTYRINK